MSEEYILFYSEQCRYSTEFLQKLYKNQEIYKKVIKVDVNDKGISIPKYVTAVPAMIIKVDNRPKLLVDNNLFDWLNNIIKTKNENCSVIDWDPTTMAGGSYSDSFSYLDTGDATVKNFSYLNINNEQIECPVDDKSNNSNNNIKTGFDKDYENLIQQRSLELPKGPPRI
mgnify:CR=1 FL=1